MNSVLLDLLLIVLLLFTGWRTFASPTLFGCIVAFTVFSLVMSLAWLRLGAPDIALAEAAVGAGVTGAILMAALGRIQGSLDSSEEKEPS